MKHAIHVLISAAILQGCGGANDGDARTDTTTMPVDTNLNKTDVNHVNSAEGTTVADSTKKDSSFSH